MQIQVQLGSHPGQSHMQICAAFDQARSQQLLRQVFWGNAVQFTDGLICTLARV